MTGTRNIFKNRNLLVWAIVLLIMPFGFILENPEKAILSFLGK